MSQFLKKLFSFFFKKSNDNLIDDIDRINVTDISQWHFSKTITICIPYDVYTSILKVISEGYCVPIFDVSYGASDTIILETGYMREFYKEGYDKLMNILISHDKTLSIISDADVQFVTLYTEII